MKSSKKISLPRTAADLEAMSAAEIDAAIAELRRLQKKSLPPPHRLSVWGDGFGAGFGGRWDFQIPSIEESWAQDAANLRGDFERVGRDMWIGMLQHAKSEKRG